MRKFLGVLLAGTLVLGACGGDGDGGPDPSENPEAALVEALKDLGEEGFSTTLSLNSDTESLEAAFAEEEDVPEGIADTILDSSMTFASNNAEKPEDAQAEVIFELGGEDAAEFLVDGYDLYAHADVPYIMETFGADPSLLEQELAEIPPALGFVKQAVEGEWIHLTGLEQFIQQAQGAGTEAPDLAKQQKQLIDTFVRTLEENSEVTEGEEEGPGTHLEAKVDVQSFAQDFEQLAGQLVPGAPAPSGAPDDLPSVDIVLDTWVDEGSLKQLEFDIVKNADALGQGEPLPEGVEELALLMVFEDFDGEVDPPDDAVEVSFQEILGALASGFVSGGTDSGVESGAGGGGGGAVDPCEEVADLPPEQQEPFKDICPDL